MGNTLPIQLFFIILLVLIAFYFLVRLGKEGFNDVNKLQADYSFDRRQNYNPLGVALIASGTEGTLGSSADPMTGTVGSSTSYPLSTNKSGLFATIAMCEKVKINTDGSVFDNPNFAANCGLCLDIGKDSKGNPTTGGLVLLEKDRKTARAATVGNAIPNYIPTVGTCPANRLVSSKAEWERLTRRLECERKGTYDIKDCSQCYDDQSYTTVDQIADGGVVAGAGTIHIVGSGTISYSEQGYGNGKATLSSTPYLIRLQGPETTRVTITATGTTSYPAKLAGYLSGSTQSGLFTIDLYRLVMTDTVTGRKPRTEKPITVDGNSVTTMGPGFGKQQMSLNLNMPFTFVDTTSEEAGQCLSSPFITKQSSAEFMRSDPCYSKGSGPGKFTLECLQSSFLSNGCTEKGSGYPSDAVSSAALMTNKNGSLKSLSDIAEHIYDMAVSASTGISSSGKKLKIKAWSDASQFCTGKTLTSPCDADPNVDGGPLSTDCISFLWNNGGTDPSKSAYNPTSSATSLSSSGTQYCQKTGSLSPLDANGTVNATALSYWQGLGGLASVKAAMNKIHTQANSQGLSDKERLPYLTQCYGIKKLAPAPAEPSDLPHSFVCKPTTMIGKTNVTQNYSVSFDITPTASNPGQWQSILHFTTGNYWSELGGVCPGIWFAPNTLNTFAIHVGTTKDLSWAARPTIDPSSPDYLQVGKTTSFNLTCIGPTITITIGSTVFKYTQDGSRFEGFVSVYGGDIGYPNANANITNLSYTAWSPSTAPVSVFQTAFNAAGCTKQLTQGDPHWWRTQTWDTVHGDIASYARIMNNCSGQKWQKDFCSPGKCP